jgi:hypothetical protein
MRQSPTARSNPTGTVGNLGCLTNCRLAARARIAGANRTGTVSTDASTFWNRMEDLVADFLDLATAAAFSTEARTLRPSRGKTTPSNKRMKLIEARSSCRWARLGAPAAGHLHWSRASQLIRGVGRTLKTVIGIRTGTDHEQHQLETRDSLRDRGRQPFFFHGGGARFPRSRPNTVYANDSVGFRSRPVALGMGIHSGRCRRHLDDVALCLNPAALRVRAQRYASGSERSGT